MAAKTVNVGLIGTKFMGKAHSNAYLKVAKFFDPEPAAGDESDLRPARG